MTTDEKAQQIGLAVSEYQAAKTDLAHLEQKVSQVGEVYKQVGESLANRSGMSDYKIEGGSFQVLYGRTGKGPLTDLLLDEAHLVALIKERDEARTTVRKLREKLKSLGITSVE